MATQAIHDIVRSIPFVPHDLHPHPAVDAIPVPSRTAIQSAFATIADILPPASALELIEAILDQLPEAAAPDQTGPHRQR